MDSNMTKWVLIGAAVVLVIYWLSKGGGGSTLSTGGISPADAVKLQEEQTAAQGSAFATVAGAVQNVATAREQTAQTTALANIQAGVENNRIAAALNGLTIQANAQTHAADVQAGAEKTKSILDSIPVIGSILSFL